MKYLIRVLDAISFVCFFVGLALTLFDYQTRIGVISMAIGMVLILILGAVTQWTWGD